MAATAREVGSPVLPPLFDRWIRELLPGPIPVETKATCSSCAMLPPEGEARSRGEQFYAADTKCCTYPPELANFLVGRVLSDDGDDAAPGRRTVEERIDS